MRYLVATFLLFVLGICSAEPLKISKQQFRSKEFIKGFVGAYGFLSPVEPEIDSEERDLLNDLTELFSDARFREAEARIVDFIKRRKNPIEEGVKPKEVSAALVFTLGQLYFQNDKTKDAERAYKLALDRHPDFRRAHKYLSLLYASQDRISEALPHLKKTIQLGEADQLIYGLMGYAYMQESKPLAAEGAYRQAYLLNPEESQWKSGLALSLYQQEKWPEASAMLGELLNESPESSDFWKLQANCYLNQNEPLRAATNFEVMRLKGLADEATLNTLGDIYTDQRKSVLALGSYLEALQKGEGLDAERGLRTAKVLADYGAPRESQKYISAVREKAAGKLARGQEIRFKLIEVRIAKDLGNQERVGALLGEVLALDPVNGEGLVENGLYFESLADTTDNEDEALELRAKAKSQFKLAMNSADEEIQYQANRSYGQMEVRQREYVDGLPFLERAVQLKPSDNLKRYVRQVQVAAEKQKEREEREAAEQEKLRLEREKKKEAAANG